MGWREDGMVEYNHDDPLLMICAHVTALQRASKNRLVELFCQLRQANGWEIVRVGEASASKAFDEAKKMLDLATNTNKHLLLAPPDELPKPAEQTTRLLLRLLLSALSK